ncbi:hypothetical protein E4U42_004230 [Claviceps africana]|uniref:Rab-GAP TBC domain-containing protein n=1 Tax=Claviceps africana TaxID=83212 RepID=A0A8K0NI85_9HYPO|nr:hypothetical protein E4U42_004230 [Claviceps africana]
MEPQDRPVGARAGSPSSDEDNLETTVVTCGQRSDDVLYEKKSDAIREACKWRDATKLRDLAETTDGFLSDELRRLAWPVLMGLSSEPHECNAGSDGGDTDGECAWEKLPRHRDEEQVQLDVDRSFVYYPRDKSEADMSKCKSELLSLIVQVLRRHPYLCYFQGYHDICQVFLLVLQPPWRAGVVARLSVLRIRDFMLPSLKPTTAQLRLLPDLLAKADPKLRQHMATIEPFFALAGTLTMYAHNIQAYRDIARLFDVILAREPVFPIYVFAQIVINRRDEVLDIKEPDMLQVVLSRVPSSMDLDALITDAVHLLDSYPPHSLPYWRHISKYSSLKTARDSDTCAKQSLEDGREYFQQQAKQLQWAEMREKMLGTIWRYRRPIRILGAAAAVAVLAFYLRRNPSAIRYLASFLR